MFHMRRICAHKVDRTGFCGVTTLCCGCTQHRSSEAYASFRECVYVDGRPERHSGNGESGGGISFGIGEDVAGIIPALFGGKMSPQCLSDIQHAPEPGTAKCLSAGAEFASRFSSWVWEDSAGTQLLSYIL